MRVVGVNKFKDTVASPPTMAHTVPPLGVLAMKRIRGGGGQASLRVHAKDDNVVLRRVFQDGLHVIDARLIRYSIAVGIRVTTNDADSPASPAEVRAKRPAMAHESDFANT